MKHFLLKFNHGVEVGAYLAYCGHFARTREFEIFSIMRDESHHKLQLECILSDCGTEPNWLIDTSFTLIGKTIEFLCKFCPIWSLNFVASTMEVFAVVNYRKLAKLYPSYSHTLLAMADTEDEHRTYFRGRK